MTYIHPVFPLLIALIIAAAWRSGAGWRRTVVIGSAVALAVWGWSPAAWLSARSLEWPYSPVVRPTAGFDAIVVLSEAIYPIDISQPEPSANIGTYLRCRYAAWLYRHGAPVPVLATGGTGPGGYVVARVMASLLEAEGVPRQMIWTEERSRSTYENALFSAEMLHSRGIQRMALVTEAYHMLRSEKAFRKQGLIVTPAPCAFRSYAFRWKPVDFLPGARMMQLNGEALHEWVGLAWYRLSGKI